jgi:hypothetical protein
MESAKVECGCGECLEEDLVPLRLVFLLDEDLDLSPKTDARDKERRARELDRLLAVSNEGLNSPEGIPELAELEILSLGCNAERNFD